ncbi:hypothetical protein B5E77_00510 [Lachnoclostridium sp. An131]|nr:hypothetical protein B5E77_00510 [Lachnoclostridium sp. An131]
MYLPVEGSFLQSSCFMRWIFVFRPFLYLYLVLKGYFFVHLRADTEELRKSASKFPGRKKE